MERNGRVLTEEERQRQQACAQRVRQLLLERMGRQPLACAVTFGCQQNEADSELLRGMLVDMGYGLTDDEEKADLLIFNTCAVREHAEMRVYGNVGQTSHYKKRNPHLLVCVCGCMAQQENVQRTLKDSYPYVDIVFGTYALWRFPELVLRRLESGKRVFERAGDERGLILEGVPSVRRAGVRAFLSIMYGCNNFCSYCIVPYVRGRERSRAPETVEREFRELVAAGYKDITLVGQNVNSYGNDLSCGVDFADLLTRLNAVPGAFRIRFMTSHPKDATPRLFDAMAACDKVCKSIHLPVQCGSDRVLQAMNRRYTVAQYRALVDYARGVMPGLTISTDIIVGFPGETESEARETIDLLRAVRFDAIFSFIYSRREGTAAAALPDPVSRAEKQKWFDELLAVQLEISREKNLSYVGSTQRVLIDGVAEDGKGDLTGRTDGFKQVRLPGGAELVGTFRDVYIESGGTWSLAGRLK